MVENKLRTILFGGSGKLGSSILSGQHTGMDIYAPSHTECDIADEKQVAETIRSQKPDLVINTAALVGTRECEQNKELAWTTNVIGAENIAKVCNVDGIRYVFISSAAIFDGKKGDYSETDPPSPTFFYANTKVAAEQAAVMVPDHAVIRLDFFPLTKLKYLQVLTDHFTSKIPVSEAADKVVRVAASALIGIINIGQERESLYNILKPYFPEITPITISESSLPNFPRDISLNLTKWKEHFEKGN